MPLKIYLALAIHNHQPVGNFDSVFEQAYQESYLPFVDVLERHPNVRMALHYTGPVFDWLYEHKPELLARVRNMVQRGQVEMIGGAYYEAVLAVIPDTAKQAQLQKLSNRITEYFGVRPTGMWLAERVWEPALPLPIGQAGLSWTLVDDTHFKSVGLGDQDLFGYYTTEEQGQMLNVFGTSKPLRYLIPWQGVDQVIDYLRSEATEDGTKIVVMGDDGEKFGHWPGTYSHCYERGWLEQFFTALETNSDWLITIPPGEYIAQFPALGRVYLPTASYDEMLEWALPAEMSAELQQVRHELATQSDQGDTKATALLRYLRGGLWRSFMVKYPEINYMHKKMLAVYNLVARLPENAHKQAALDHVLAAQSNDAYWHGVFGGIHYSHLRGAVYDHVLVAENIADAALGRSAQWVDVTLEDIDKDSVAELIVRSGAQNLYLAPHVGGMLFEWDWRAKHFNLTAAMTRRPETYHPQLDAALRNNQAQLFDPDRANNELENIHGASVKVKEWGLEHKLVYDRYSRYSLVDHFLTDDTTLDDFADARFEEQGDFVCGSYTADSQVAGGQAYITLTRDGLVRQGGEQRPVRVEKIIVLESDVPQMRVHYRITNTGTAETQLRFGSEHNFALHAGHGYGCYYRVPHQQLENDYLDSRGMIESVEGISMTLEYRKMRIEFGWSKPATLWRTPVETVVSGIESYERIYQSSCLMPLWQVNLAPGAAWDVELTFDLLELP
ncbi:MAG: DUF1926 domain-containing protein [Chloroflexota bacterium]|nr:DUF1926 domain-containing protein [Chloroflexota bacterium]